MQLQLKQYVLMVSVLVIAVGVFAVPSSAGSGPLHATVYVNCGPTSLPTFTTIQAAVDNAAAGDTIKVCASKVLYVENVNVNDAVKTLDGLRIVGDGKAHLKCPGGTGSGFDLHANDVAISAFQIEDCTSGISVESGFGGEVFTGNKIDNCTNGISFNSSSGFNSVGYNQISSNSNDGIFVFQALADAVFSNNLLNNGSNGIEMSTLDLVTVITDNVATGNGSNGVYVNSAGSGAWLLTGNTLSNNVNDGLYVNASRGGFIIGNDADLNHNNGMELSSTASGNTLNDNRMQRNTNFDGTDHAAPGANSYSNDHGKNCSGVFVCVP